MNLRDKIESFTREKGVIYGCGSAEPFYEYADTLSRTVPFVNYRAEERMYPDLTLTGAKGLIALGLSYNNSYERPQDDKLYAALSEGAVGEDYHTVMIRLLNELAELLFKGTEYKYRCFCDTGPLSDALVALRCSLGCAGLNHAVINERFGSMFFIGYIITTAEIEPINKPQNRCNNCGICVKACPSGALGYDGSFNYEVCVAYLTQKKGIIPDEFKQAMGTYIYGCDICRKVCPLTPEPVYAPGCAYPEIAELLNLSNREFQNRYGNTAIGWRGKRTIMRNALIALGNLGDERGIALAERFLTDNAEELRDAAAWAVKQMKKED